MKLMGGSFWISELHEGAVVTAEPEVEQGKRVPAPRDRRRQPRSVAAAMVPSASAWQRPSSPCIAAIGASTNP
jgi:streptogramin lyase